MMNAGTFRLVLPALAAVATLQAADPWIGSWEIASSKLVLTPSPQVTVAARPNGLEYTLRNGDKTVSWAGDFDGADYLASGDDRFDQVSLRRVDRNTVEVVMKKGGKPAGGMRAEVSAAGSELLLTTNTGMVAHDRSGGDARDDNPFVGVWTPNFTKGKLNPYATNIVSDGDDGIRVSSSYVSGSTTPLRPGWSAQFDGKEHPVPSKHRQWQTVALKRLDARTFEVYAKRAGDRPEIFRYTVSPDGRELILEGTGFWHTGARITLHQVFRKK